MSHEKTFAKEFQKKKQTFISNTPFFFRNRIFNKRYIEFNYNCEITRDIKFPIV